MFAIGVLAFLLAVYIDFAEAKLDFLLPILDCSICILESLRKWLCLVRLLMLVR